MPFISPNESKLSESELKVRTGFRRLSNRTPRRKRRAPAPMDSAGRDCCATVEEMSRADLSEYARELEVELARLTAQLAKPLGQAFKLALVSRHRGELGVTTDFDPSGVNIGGYDSAFHVVFEIAQQALRRTRADCEVERQFARLHPEAAAALVALRRHALRDARDWPDAARRHYERDFVGEMPYGASER